MPNKNVKQANQNTVVSTWSLLIMDKQGWFFAVIKAQNQSIARNLLLSCKLTKEKTPRFKWTGSFGVGVGVGVVLINLSPRVLGHFILSNETHI